jgi:N-methylhydantoinase A
VRRRLIATAADALGEPAQQVRVSAELRYLGQSFELSVSAPCGMRPDRLCETFAGAHEERYGYRDDDSEIELVTLRVSVFGSAPDVRLSAAAGQPPRQEMRPVWFAGEELQTLCLRGALPPGTELEGPALCALPEATLLLPPGWHGVVDAQGTAILTEGAGSR